MKKIQQRTNQKGFTLIELLVVVIVLSILSVVALPKFMDLEEGAALSSAEGVAAALSSGSTMNHALNKASDAGVLDNPADLVEVLNCTDVEDTLETGLPEGYTINNGNIAGAEGTMRDNCVLNGDSGATANFVAHKVFL